MYRRVDIRQGSVQWGGSVHLGQLMKSDWHRRLVKWALGPSTLYLAFCLRTSGSSVVLLTAQVCVYHPPSASTWLQEVNLAEGNQRADEPARRSSRPCPRANAPNIAPLSSHHQDCPLQDLPQTQLQHSQVSCASWVVVVLVARVQR